MATNEPPAQFESNMNTRMCRSTRQSESEVWFRIVHVVQHSENGIPVTANRGRESRLHSAPDTPTGQETNSLLGHRHGQRMFHLQRAEEAHDLVDLSGA